MAVEELTEAEQEEQRRLREQNDGMGKPLNDQDKNWLVYNTGRNVSPAFNFMLRVEGLFDLPCRRVHSFTKANEYEYIQEGGLNDYVHMRRKPVSQPFTFQVERYVGVDYLDPLQPGTDLILPVVLIVCRLPITAHFVPFRVYTFTGCTVMSKEYGELNAEQSGLHTETTTIGYREMMRITVPDGLWDGPQFEMAQVKATTEELKDSKGRTITDEAGNPIMKNTVDLVNNNRFARSPIFDKVHADNVRWTGLDDPQNPSTETLRAKRSIVNRGDNKDQESDPFRAEVVSWGGTDENTTSARKTVVRAQGHVGRSTDDTGMAIVDGKDRDDAKPTVVLWPGTNPQTSSDATEEGGTDAAAASGANAAAAATSARKTVVRAQGHVGARP